MKERIQKFIRRFQPIYQNRWVRISAQVLIISLAVWYLYRQYQGAGEIISKIEFDYQILALALILTILAVFLGALAWGFTLLMVNQTVTMVESIRIHLLSNLAKYIPGYAWQLIGKAYLTNQQGVPGVIAGIAIIAELLQLVMIGLGLALLLLPSVFTDYWIDFLPQLDILVLRIIGIVILITFPIVLNYILKRTSRLPTGLNIQSTWLVYSYASILIGWLVFGLAFWLIGSSVIPLPTALLPAFIFTLAASIIIGLAIVIVPGSIGVRESIMVFLLTNIGILAPIAVIIAIISRLIVTLSEVLSYFTYQVFVYSRQANRFEKLE